MNFKSYSYNVKNARFVSLTLISVMFLFSRCKTRSDDSSLTDSPLFVTATDDYWMDVSRISESGNDFNPFTLHAENVRKRRVGLDDQILKNVTFDFDSPPSRGCIVLMRKQIAFNGSSDFMLRVVSDSLSPAGQSDQQLMVPTLAIKGCVIKSDL